MLLYSSDPQVNLKKAKANLIGILIVTIVLCMIAYCIKGWQVSLLVLLVMAAAEGIDITAAKNASELIAKAEIDKAIRNGYIFTVIESILIIILWIVLLGWKTGGIVSCIYIAAMAARFSFMKKSAN
jgi:hypothetical protein